MDNNDFILKIVAELEQKGIKTGFDKLKKELEKNPAKIDVILDTSGTVGRTKGSIKKLAAELHNELSVEISKLQKQGQNINFDLSVGDVEEVIQNVINHTKKLGESFDVASDKAQKFLAKFNKKSGGVLINSDEFKAVQEAINGLGNTHTIEDLNKAMNTLEVTYDNMSSKLRNSGKSLNPFINAKNEMATMDKTIEGISLEFDKLSSKPDDVANAIKELSVQQNKVNNFAVGTMEWADAYGHLQEMIRNVTKDISNLQKAQSSKSLQPRIYEIQLLSNGGIKNDYATQLAVLEGRFSRLGLKEDEVSKKTSNVNTAFNNLKQRLSQPFDESNFQEIIVLNDKFQKELIESQNELTRLGTSIKMATDSSRLNNVNQMQKWADNNGKAMKKWGTEINDIIAKMGDLNVPMPKLESDRLLNDFKKIKNEAIETGNVGMTTAQKFSNAWNKIGGWSLVTGAFTKIAQGGREMYKAVYDIDTAMTNLYKVTDETSQKYNQFLESSSKSAHELGRSISSLVEQTANWAKLGFSLDEAEQLAKISSIYANVGEVDNNTAVSDMVTAMKAFNIEASDSITIVDKLNKLGNEYATSAAALGDGLSRSASAMATSGTDINKTLAMLTGGTEITQNASEFGNFLKIGSMRIRGMKGDLEELGEEVDETVDSISKVQTQILNRTGGKVNIFDDMGNFRDYYDIMEDISEIYNELSDPDKADLTEILFGKQRGNQGAALIQAFQSGQIQKALDATLNAEGSAMQEQERWMESLEAKTAQFEAAFQKLSNTILNSNLVKFFVDLGTSGVGVLDAVIDKLGSLGTIGTIGGAIAGANGLG